MTENYPEPFLKELYSSEYLTSSEKTSSVETPPEVSTENIPYELYSETTIPINYEHFGPTHEDHQEYYTQKAVDNENLEHLFTKTEVKSRKNFHQCFDCKKKLCLLKIILAVNCHRTFKKKKRSNVIKILHVQS